MKRKQHRIFPVITLRGVFTFVLAVIFVVLGAYSVFVYLMEDRTPPEISFASSRLTLNVEETEQVLEEEYAPLLQDVTAEDEHDGSLTYRVVVERAEVDEEAGTASVVYLASDAAGNLARRVRTVELYGENTSRTGKTEAPAAESYPYILLNEEEIEIEAGETVDLLSYVAGVADNKDSIAQLNENITIHGDYDLTKIGVYQIKYTVTDSDGNISEPAKLIIHVT